jgi:hypothetical protein
MSNCWLEVSLLPKDPWTGQHDQGISVVFFGPRANADLALVRKRTIPTERPPLFGEKYGDLALQVGGPQMKQ